MPIPVVAAALSRILLEETYDTVALAEAVAESVPLLNNEQKVVYERVMSAVRHKEPALFHLDACGGAGKTFVSNLLLDTVRAEGKVALAAASSGIAALLLHNGRTAHSRFKIPLEGLHAEARCASVAPNSSLAELLRQASLIIW